MDGSQTPSSFVVADWIDRAARAPAFLQRDLSEEGLRPPAEPSFGAEDLRAAERRGYESGHAAGLAEAEASQAAFATMALAAIAGEMTSSRAAAAAVAEEAAAALARALLAAMQAVMPALIAATAAGEIDAMLAHVLPGLAREPEIAVSVAPDLAEAVGARLQRLSRTDRDRIAVAGVDGMAPGAARIAWAAGHAERDPAEVWRQVMQALRLTAGNETDKETNDDR
jgi:flagellar biosynthesis/type III secretory pathway protein FliH